MPLYKVSFTTKKIVNRYDEKGKLVESREEQVQVTHTALPHAAAMSYSTADNFAIEEYFLEQQKKTKPSTKINFDHARAYGRSRSEKHLPEPNGPATRGGRVAPRHSTVAEAARTGDLTAALNKVEAA